MLAALDCETTGVNLFHGDLPFMACITFEDKRQEVFEWLVDPYTRIPKYELDDLLYLVSLLNNPEYTWVLHNAKFDTRCIEVAISQFLFKSNYVYGTKSLNAHKYETLYNWSGSEFIKGVHDTHLMSHAYDNLGSHGLKDLGVRFLNIGEDDQYALYEQIREVHKLVSIHGWKVANSTNCPLVTKKPNDGWEVMDMWLPRAYREFQLSMLGEVYQSPKPGTRKPSESLNSKLLTPIGTSPLPGTSSIPQDVNQSRNPTPNPDKLDVFDNRCKRYCLRDTERTLLLYLFFEKQLVDLNLWDSYADNQATLSSVYAMESYGVSVNPDRLVSEKTRLASLSVSYEKQAQRIALNPHLSLTSPEQVAATLMTKFDITPPRKTKTSKFTVDQKELEQMFEVFIDGSSESVPDYLLNVSPEKIPSLKSFLIAAMSSKRCSTASSNYLTGYYRMLCDDCLLHPSFNLVGTSTTRFSSSNPNGQNISKGKTAFIPELQALLLSLRKVFGPLPGRKWWSCDYKQLQLVIFGTISNENEMMAAVERGEDFHDFTTRAIFDLGPNEQPTDAQRTIGKNVNFGYLFGAGPDKIEKTARMPGLYTLVKSRFPSAHAFIKRNIKEVKEHGYVYADDYRLYVDSKQAYAATNYKVQGYEGLIVKQAMRYCHEYLESHPEFDVHLTLNVHDELVFDAPSDAPDYVLDHLIYLMELAGTHRKIPCKVDAKIHSSNWAEGVKYDGPTET